jgi:hypothetical protein
MDVSGQVQALVALTWGKIMALNFLLTIGEVFSQPKYTYKA